MANDYSTVGVVTDAEYVASRDPRLQAMRQLNVSIANGSIPDLAARETLAVQLAALGIDTDGEIMVEGHDAQVVMAYRAYQKIVWAPSFDQPLPPIAQQLVGPPPPHSIPTITDPAAYPPFDAVTPPPLPETSPVGAPMFTSDGLGTPGSWNANMTVVFQNGSWQYREADPIAFQGQTLYFHKTYGVGGPGAIWENAEAKTARLKLTGASA